MSVIRSLLKLDVQLGALSLDDLKPGGIVFVSSEEQSRRYQEICADLREGERLFIERLCDTSYMSTFLPRIPDENECAVCKSVCDSLLFGGIRLGGAPICPSCFYKTQPGKTCISCGAKTDMAGNLPCGH